MASQDPIVIPRLDGLQYQPVLIEPFTQTAYRSLLAPDQRRFNSSLLANCSEGHFTIRLQDRLPNRSTPIMWAPVVGLGEQFTFGELLLFPTYILRNHSMWNELPWTYWVWLFVGAPLVIFWMRVALQRCGVSVFMVLKPSVRLREIFYQIAIVAFSAAAFEELTHLLYAQSGHPVGHEFFVGLFAVILFAQGVPILYTYTVWVALLHEDDAWCISHPSWSILDLVTSLSFFVFLGSGFYIGPTALTLAALLRCYETLCHDSRRRADEYPPSPTSDTRSERPIVTELEFSKSLGFAKRERV